MALLFGVCFFLYFVKLSAGKGFSQNITMKIYGIKLDKYYANKSNSRHQFD